MPVVKFSPWVMYRLVSDLRLMTRFAALVATFHCRFVDARRLKLRFRVTREATRLRVRDDNTIARVTNVGWGVLI